jgi:hypothetical protein
MNNQIQQTYARTTSSGSVSKEKTPRRVLGEKGMFRKAIGRVKAALDNAAHGQAALAHAHHHYGVTDSVGTRMFALKVWIVDFVGTLVRGK